jgi:hypothetical protein
LAVSLAAGFLPPGASGQTSFIAPDGHNRYPGVTIFCPSGTGVAPCAFGGSGSTGGAVTLNLSSGPVSASNRLPVSDSAIDSLIDAGALSIGGTVSLAGTPTVALGAGTNAIGSLTVSNFPAIQPVSGALSQAGSWTVGLAAGTTVGLSAGSSVGLAPGSSVGVTSLPALPAGSNAIGSVNVSNFPAVQPVSGAVSQTGSWSVGLAAGSSVNVASLPALPAGGNAIGTVSVSNLPGVQPISGAVSQAGTWSVGLAPGTALALSAGSSAIGSVSVSNLPVTQAVSAASLPLPAGAATAVSQTAPLGPVTPGSGTATASMVIGCVANTTLPSFTAGQQGAVPCDTSGRPYVVTVPSANNVPAYLQAVSTGGAAVYRAINAASSTMAANLKSGSGMVYGYEACNSGTSAAYLRLFALGTAPTVGTSVPQVSKLLAAGSCQTMTTTIGLVFSSGIAMDVTSGTMADSDTAAVTTANQVSVEVYFK